ncbi:unnamed protein product, partial [Symbiodinium pilosum]
KFVSAGEAQATSKPVASTTVPSRIALLNSSVRGVKVAALAAQSGSMPAAPAAQDASLPVPAANASGAVPAAPQPAATVTAAPATSVTAAPQQLNGTAGLSQGSAPLLHVRGTQVAAEPKSRLATDRSLHLPGTAVEAPPAQAPPTQAPQAPVQTPGAGLTTNRAGSPQAAPVQAAALADPPAPAVPSAQPAQLRMPARAAPSAAPAATAATPPAPPAPALGHQAVEDAAAATPTVKIQELAESSAFSTMPPLPAAA